MSEPDQHDIQDIDYTAAPHEVIEAVNAVLDRHSLGRFNAVDTGTDEYAFDFAPSSPIAAVNSYDPSREANVMALVEAARRLLDDLVIRADVGANHPNSAVRQHFTDIDGNPIINASNGVLADLIAALKAMEG